MRLWPEAEAEAVADAETEAEVKVEAFQSFPQAPITQRVALSVFNICSGVPRVCPGSPRGNLGSTFDN